MNTRSIFLIESDEALAEHHSAELTPIGRAIGEQIAPLIKDNSTLQLGIGSIPDATLELLKSRNGMRIWTETFSDGVLNMEEANALDEGVPITASFAFGTKRLYEWMHLNRRIRMFRTEKTNDPSQIGRQARMTSINGTMQIDLYDQANASRIRGKFTLVLADLPISLLAHCTPLEDNPLWPCNLGTKNQIARP